MASWKRADPKLISSKKHTTDKIPKFIKMKVIDDLTSTTINQEVRKEVDPDAHLQTDKYRSYNKLTEIVEEQTAYDMSKFDTNKVLPWVHKAIANSKNLLKAIHHCVSDDYLQNYLSEFCFKYNRRYFGEKTFDRLLIAAVSNQWN